MQSKPIRSTLLLLPLLYSGMSTAAPLLTSQQSAVTFQNRQASWRPEYLWYGQTQDLRCAVDSLSANEAIGRVKWAAGFDSEEVAQYYSWITAATADFMTVYGSLNETIKLAQDSWLKLPNGSARPRPQYPLYGSGSLEAGQVWAAPRVESPVPAIDRPEEVHIRGACTSSCYRPEVRIFVPGQYVSIKDMFDKNSSQVVTLSDNATLNNLEFQTTSVLRYTTEVLSAWHKIVVLETASGGKLLVTTNHPLVDQNGIMREAATFTESDSLIRIDGTIDPISSIKIENYYGKVYNLTPAGTNHLSHVVVAEGYLSGSAWYQNDGYSNMNRDIFRMQIEDSLVGD